MPTRPASGWYATVTPSGGHEYAVDILADGDRSVAYAPKANARPSIRLPAALSNKWADVLGDGSSAVDLDVFHDGNRLAIDTLDDVDETPGANVLVGSGGRELETRIEESIDQEAVHTAAERLIDNNTTYTSNVDTPTTTTESNTTLITLTSNSDFLTRIQSLLDTQPITVESGTIKLEQTCFTVEGESHTRNSGTNTFEDSRFSGDGVTNGDGVAEEIEASGEWVEYDFTPGYTIPADDVEILVRRDLNNSPAIDATLNGVTWEVMSDGGSFLGGPAWDDIADANATGVTDGYTGGDLIGGTTYTLRLEGTSAGGTSPTHQIDVVAPRDGGGDRFTPNYNDDDALETNANNNRAFDGPELFPDEFQVKFDIVTAPEAVTGARAEATLDEGASDYTHYVSNDQGANFTTGTGSNFETDSLGASFGPGVTYKAGLSRTGTQEPTPQEGHKGTGLQALTIKADLSSMPIVVNTSFDGSLASVLTQLANIGDQLWAYERSGSTESIEWTTPGQRTTTKTLDPSTYNVTKTVADVYQKAAVYGQPDVNRTGERFESSHGAAVSLAQNRVKIDSEVVIDPDTGERFRRNEDYTLDYQAGEITVLAAGDMADATAYEIDYQYQPFGEFDDGTMNPDTIEVNIPGLTTDFACEQAAQLIVNEVNTPLWTAEITLTKVDVNFSVVDSIDPDIVPTGGNALHVRENPTSPADPRLILGSRRSANDVVDDIRTQVGSVSRPS